MADVLAGAAAHAALLRGMDRMTRLLRPTLGPLPRTVAVSPIIGSQPPEILDSAATIARRTIQFPDVFQNMGAMLVRHLVWRMFERVGDGTAASAVLAYALVRAAMRATSFGADPLCVTRGIARGLAVVQTELRRSARPIETPSEIASVVSGTVRRTDLAEMIGEVLDAVGADGSILVEEAQTTATTLDYAEGLRWNEGYLSPYFVAHDQSLARLTNPRILATDYALERAEQLVPALEVCVAAGDRNLLIVAPEIRDSAVALLLRNRERGVLDAAVAVRAPSSGVQRTNILEDIAIVTGGRCISRDQHDALATVAPGDLGRARQAWATRTAFGIVGGRGDRTVVRQRIAAARAELQAAEDSVTRRTITERIGKLAGTAATIHVGAHTTAEREELRSRIESALSAARLALRDGVVAGAGAALVTCLPVLEAMDMRGDEAIGVSALASALAEPLRVILANAGLEPQPIVCETRRRGGREVFDVLARAWVDPWQAGILDPVAVVLAAVESGVSLATTALTADVLVHRTRPPLAMQP